MKSLIQKLFGLAMIFATTLVTNAQSEVFSIELSLGSSPLLHSKSRILNNGNVISTLYDNNTSSSHIILLSSNGNKLWSKAYATTRLDDIAVLPSGNIAFIGYNDYNNIWGILDANGNPIWAKQYYSANSNYDLASIDVLKNGSILYNFSKYALSTTIRCDEDGNVDDMDEGSDSLGYGKNPCFDSFECEDSGYVSSCKSDDRIMLVRHNQHGDVVWAKNYMKSTTDYFHLKKIQELPNGDFMGVGLICDSYAGANNNGFMIRFDANGEVLWAKKYPFPTNPGFFSSTFRTFEVDDNNIFVGGYYTSDNLNMLNFFIQLDNQGNVITSKQILNSNSALLQVLAPTMSYVSFEQDMHMHQMVYNNYNTETAVTVELNKVSFNGTLGCNVVDFVTTAIPYTSFTGSTPAQYNQISILETNPSSITDFVLTVNNSDLEVTTSCSNVAGIEEASNLSLQAYPNPSTEQVTINGLKMDSRYLIKVVDITGKILLTKNGITSVEFTQMEVMGLSAGSYFIQVTDVNTNQSYQLKWIKG